MIPHDFLPCCRPTLFPKFARTMNWPYVSSVFFVFALCVAGCGSEKAVDDGNESEGQALIVDSTVAPDSAGDEFFNRTNRDLDSFDEIHGAVYESGIVPIHYLQMPRADGVPLILLHGTYNTSHEFVSFLQPLMDLGFRPISVDWYGHGKTGLPDKPVSVHDMAKDLAGLMNDLNIESAVICGHSRGGMIATAFYESFPSKTRGLILMDGGSTSPKNYFSSLGADGLKDWMLEAFDEETGEPKAPSFKSQKDLFLQKWNQLGQPTDTTTMFEVLAQASQRDDGRWSQWRQSISRWLEQDNLENTFNGMHRPEESPLFISSCTMLEPIEIFSNLDVPVMILDAVGRDKDYRDPTPGSENELLVQEHPDFVRYIEYPTGHYLHREKPDQFISDIAKFKSSIAGSSK